MQKIRRMTIIMFDNMTPEEISEAVEKLKNLGLRDSIILEASGNATLKNVEVYTSTGVDVLSSGYIIHSAKPLDFGMYVV